MFLRKMIFIIGLIIIISSCSDELSETESRAIIKFSYEDNGWSPIYAFWYPVRFFHTNPICTGMPEHRVWYYTEPGQYYLEYVLLNNRAYYMIYTIEIWKTSGTTESTDEIMVDGEIKQVRGRFKRFEIDLNAFPGWDDDGDYYVHDVEIEPIRGEIPSRSVIPMGRNIGPLLGRIKQEQEGASMTIEYGILYEGE